MAEVFAGGRQLPPAACLRPSHRATSEKTANGPPQWLRASVRNTAAVFPSTRSTADFPITTAVHAFALGLAPPLPPRFPQLGDATLG
jgi:hypothetical protein